MAILAGGAMRVTDAKNKCAEMATDCIGFLDLAWHGAHDGGTGIARDIYARVPLADETPNGQFEFYFCSTRCLRAFLGAWVDRLDEKIEQAARKSKRHRDP